MSENAADVEEESNVLLDESINQSSSMEKSFEKERKIVSNVVGSFVIILIWNKSMRSLCFCVRIK